MSPGWTATDAVHVARQPRFGGSMKHDASFPATGAAGVGTRLGLGGEVEGSAGDAENADAAAAAAAAAGPKLSIYDDWEGDDDDDFGGVI